MKTFFELPIDAVHAFYTIIAYWDITSTIAENEGGELRVVGFKGNRMSDAILVPHKHVKDLKSLLKHNIYLRMKVQVLQLTITLVGLMKYWQK